jgi:hypothetical protein
MDGKDDHNRTKPRILYIKIGYGMCQVVMGFTRASSSRA